MTTAIRDTLRPATLSTLALVTGLYVVTGWLGLQLALPPGYATPLFPPAGLALGALLLWGRTTSCWPCSSPPAPACNA